MQLETSTVRKDTTVQTALKWPHNSHARQEHTATKLADARLKSVCQRHPATTVKAWGIRNRLVNVLSDIIVLLGRLQPPPNATPPIAPRVVRAGREKSVPWDLRFHCLVVKVITVLIRLVWLQGLALLGTIAFM